MSSVWALVNHYLYLLPSKSWSSHFSSTFCLNLKIILIPSSLIRANHISRSFPSSLHTPHRIKVSTYLPLSWLLLTLAQLPVHTPSPNPSLPRAWHNITLDVRRWTCIRFERISVRLSWMGFVHHREHCAFITDQPVNGVWGNSRCLLWEPYGTHRYAVWALQFVPHRKHITSPLQSPAG
jgi:hypothetical protein